MREQAQADIENWWRERRVEDERIGEEARQAGFEQGFQAGLAEAEAAVRHEYDGMLQEARAILEQAYTLKQQIIQEAEPFLIEMSGAIAEKIVDRQLTLEPSWTIEQIKKLLQRRKEKGTIALCVAPSRFAYIQDAPHLYITALIALVFKAIIIPVALHRMIVQLGIHREIEAVAGIGPTMLAGIGLVGLSLAVMLHITASADLLAREDLAFALSVLLLGLLIMVTRRNAVGQVVGFMSLENGLVLAATGAKGMPLVVEISVAFSVLIAFIVIGIFLFRIRERFDTVDMRALDRVRGDRR